MENQKMSDELALALYIPDSQLERASQLKEGYEAEKSVWELIVKYNGEIDRAVAKIGGRVEKLLGGYAIVFIGKGDIDKLTQLKEVEYIEKPNRLYYAASQAIRASCVENVWKEPLGLTGRGVLVAVIDSGIDWKHRDFINADGTTRILRLWDQTVLPEVSQLRSPQGYLLGTEYTDEDINKALVGDEEYLKKLEFSIDYSGHGTFVAGEAAGNGRESMGVYQGVAYECSLIVVKLGNSGNDEYPRTTRLMEAIDYVITKAVEFNLPVAINLSFGNNQGSHDGTDLLSTYLDAAADVWKTAIICGSGNEAGAGNHASGFIADDRETVIEWSVGEYETSLNLNLWKNYSDEIMVDLIAPSGQRISNLGLGLNGYVLGETQVYTNYGEPKPYSRFQQIYFEFIPRNLYVESGVWRIVLKPVRIVDGQYDAWLPESQTVNRDTVFFYPDENTTLTIPSAAFKVITVGAYNSRTNAYAEFSGRGYTRTEKAVKPDIVAPGVNVTSTAVGGGYTVRTGTSMAVPIVTGSAALLMQWGIVNKNDIYLYGQKIKAWLIKGAKPLAESEIYPNPRNGWGALCLEDSLKK